MAVYTEPGTTWSGNWYLCDTGGALDSEANNTALTTSYVLSSGFSPSASANYRGIMVKIAAADPASTATVSVSLYNNTDGAMVSGSEVTVNASQLPLCTTATAGGGWAYFVFATPVALLTSKNYSVQAKMSDVTLPVNLYRDSTAGNWSRYIVSDTTGTPGAGDNAHIVSSLLGGSSRSNKTVTYSGTAATDYGSGSTSLASISVSKGCTLQFGTSASTNYVMRVSGLLIVYNEGTFNIGTSGSRMPSTSTAVLEFDCAADGDFGLLSRGASSTVSIKGNSLSYDRTYLAADMSAAATSATTADSTGWKSGDTVVLSPTRRLTTETDARNLSVDASGTSLTLSSGVTYVHSGTSPFLCRVINITRNVRIRSVSSTAMAYTSYSGVVDIDWTEFYYMGTSTSSKKPITFLTGATGTINRCSIHDTEYTGVYYNTFTAGNTSITNNVFYNTNTSANVDGVITYSGMPTGTVAVTGNIAIVGTDGFRYYPNVTADANEASAMTSVGCRLLGGVAPIVSWGSFTAHSCATGVFINGTSGIAWGYWNGVVTLWRNTTLGFENNSSSTYTGGLKIKEIIAYGNANRNVRVNAGEIEFEKLTLNGDTTYSTPTGLELSQYCIVRVGGGNIGVASGSKTTHTTADIVITANFIQQLYLNNVTFGSVSEISALSSLRPGGFIRATNYDGVAGNHKTWFPKAIVSIDTSIYDTTPSTRITPSDSAILTEVPILQIPVNSGQAASISVKMRESVSGDGADYNGARPRLILKQNSALGINTDTVLATGSAAAEGAWETLSATTASAAADGVFQIVVDCNGTVGWINIDSISVTVA